MSKIVFTDATLSGYFLTLIPKNALYPVIARGTPKEPKRA